MGGPRKHLSCGVATKRLILLSGEVCQAYLAGCCNEGLDCRFSHPTAADELEHSVAFASPPTESHYAYIDAWSPISPLYINPFAAMQLTPPSPMTEGGCSDTSEKTLTIDTLVARPGSQYFPARVVLDGETLLPRDSPSSHTFIEDDVSSPPNSRSPSPGPFVADEIGARAIVRPVSTPPSTSATASFSKVVRVSANCFKTSRLTGTDAHFTALCRRDALTLSCFIPRFPAPLIYTTLYRELITFVFTMQMLTIIGISLCRSFFLPLLLISQRHPR